MQRLRCLLQLRARPHYLHGHVLDVQRIRDRLQLRGGPHVLHGELRDVQRLRHGLQLRGRLRQLHGELRDVQRLRHVLHLCRKQFHVRRVRVLLRIGHYLQLLRGVVWSLRL